MKQHEKIIALLIRKHGTQEWFHAYHFMPPHLPMNDDCFIGYEASARISELCGDYPDLIETRKEGKYRTIRFKFENIHFALTKLPDNLRDTATRELITIGLLKTDTF